MTTTAKTETARNLSLFNFALGDGAIILRVSITRKAVYVKAIKRGQPVRRRYRLDQQVEVEH